MAKTLNPLIEAIFSGGALALRNRFAKLDIKKREKPA